MSEVFYCEFYEISKNKFFIEHLWWLLLYEVTLEISGTSAFTKHKK